MQFVWQVEPGLAIALVAVLVVQAALSPLQLALSRATIDRAALDLGVAGATASADPLVTALPLGGWIALFVVTLAAGHLLQPCAGTFQAVIGDRLTGHVTEQLIVAANRWQGLARFEDPGFADDLQRARTRAAGSGLVLLLVLSQALLFLLTAAGAVLVLAALHPLLPVGLLLAMAPHAAQERTYQSRTGRSIYAQTPDTRRLEYARNVLLTPEAGKDVRLYGLGPYFRQRYDAIFRRAIAPLDRLRRAMAARITLAAALGGVGAGAVYVYVVWSIAQSERTLGDLALYGGAATLLRSSLTSIFNWIGIASESFAFLPSLQRVLEAPPDLPVPAHPLPAPRPIREGIVFEHVAFAYPTEAKDEGRTTKGARRVPVSGTSSLVVRPSSLPVLRDISFTIKPGECVALVGHNGAGKTTLVKLMLRLYDPTAGRILLDGTDLREYDLANLRREMGVIFQDFVRYELTAGENIGVGKLDALYRRTRLLDAAARAGADEVITRLPNGLDTQLGREFGGRELSGGEWQRLALARAFMRDAQVLVLDEPTAALDVQTEHAVYTRFHELTRDRTTLLISHRFSTVRMADRILYLAGGEIQEEGSHDELMSRNGEYARLYRLQAAQYLETPVSQETPA